jgi:NAD(P)-dependent dehydrogenase (short-subunit alcohol dehydrogenase family)
MPTSWSLDHAPGQRGRVAIVTGANTGLGYETAVALATLGARVVLACRDAARAEAASERILASQPGAQLEVRLIDTGDLDSVRAFAEGFRRDHRRLDLLVNNAGIMITPYFRTAQGFEGQLGVNYIGHFLLTGLLMPLLAGTEGARVVSLYSLAASWGGIRFEDLHFEGGYDARMAYAQSKMACLMFGIELNERLRSAGVEARSFAAHPGLSQSDLSRNLSPGIRAMLWLIGPLLLQSAARGALPTLYGALGEDLAGGEAIGPNGRRQARGDPRVVRPFAEARDAGRRARLWQESEAMCGFRYAF